LRQSWLGLYPCPCPCPCLDRPYHHQS
jgi:hypothetical protein